MARGKTTEERKALRKRTTADAEESLPSGDSRSSRLLPIWILLAVAAVVAAYANHFHNSFHFDDSHTIVENVYIRDLHNIPRFFTDATTFSSLPANQTWRPIVSLSLALDYKLARGSTALSRCRNNTNISDN